MRMRAFRSRRTTEGVLDLRNEAVSKKTPPIYLPSLPVEYVTSISGRTDAPEVKHTQTNPTTVTLAAEAHAQRGLRSVCLSAQHLSLRIL